MAKPNPPRLNPAHDAAVKRMLAATLPKYATRKAPSRKVQPRRVEAR